MKIIAIDPSLVATGVCFSTGETAVIKTKGKTGVERLGYLQDEVLDCLPTHLGVTLVVIEGYSYGSKGRALFQIGELGGVIRLGLHRLGVPWVEVPPTCLKKYATGKGNATKDEVIQQAVVRSGHTFQDNNAADAWWLWLMATDHYSTLPRPMPAENRKALDKIEWVSLG